MGDMPILLDS
ncbi:hypothetical protein LINPERHAP2_LOCUS3484 [Linum perenne]